MVPLLINEILQQSNYPVRIATKEETTENNANFNKKMFQSDLYIEVTENNIESLKNAIVENGWDGEESIGTSFRVLRHAIKFAEFLDAKKFPPVFISPNYNGGLSFIWAPGITKKLFLKVQLEINEDAEIEYHLYIKNGDNKLFSGFISDLENLKEKTLEFFERMEEI